MDSLKSVVIKIIGMISGLLLSILLANKIGASGLGIINLTLKISSVIVIISLFGMRQVIIKEVAIANNYSNKDKISSIVFSALVFSTLVSVIVALIVIFLSNWLATNVFKMAAIGIPLSISCIAVIPQVISRIFSSGLIGIGKIWQSNLVDHVISNIVTLFFILILLITYKLTVLNVAIAYAIGRIVVTIIIYFFWSKLNFNGNKKNILKDLIKTSIPFFYVSLSTVVFLEMDIIIIGYFLDSADIGLYSVAARLALLPAFLLQVVNSAITPKYAYLFETGRIKELQLLVKNITKSLLVVSILPVFIFFVFGSEILSFWGNDFTSAFFILLILSIGQFFNISFTSANVLLNMCGYEKVQKTISLVFIAVFLFFQIILTKYFGLIGSALSTSITLILFNIVRVIFLWKKLKIRLI